MIELDADQKTPLYEQLYAALADEIRTGQRAPGTPLPGRRTMAAQQGVSVNTVDAAYQMLAAEGLAEPRPRSGFYVQKTYGMLHSRARHAPAVPAPQPPAAPQTISNKKPVFMVPSVMERFAPASIKPGGRPGNERLDWPVPKFYDNAGRLRRRKRRPAFFSWNDGQASRRRDYGRERS